MIDEETKAILQEGAFLEKENNNLDALKAYLRPFVQDGVILFDKIHPKFDAYVQSVLRVLNKLSGENKFEPIHIKFFNPIIKNYSADKHESMFIFQNALLHSVREFISMGYVTNDLNFERLNINTSNHPVEVKYNLDDIDSTNVLYEEDFISSFLSPIFTEAIEKNVIINIPPELLFTSIRKLLLLECYQNLDKLNESDLLPLLKSISHQCFINEYIWFVGSDEKEIIEKIKNRVLENEKLSPVEICILGSYKSLNHYKDINEIILNQKFDIEIETIITEQIKNFDLENELKKGIEKLSQIKDQISIKVRDQYEENPYPRWPDNFISNRKKGLQEQTAVYAMPYENVILNSILPNKIKFTKKIENILIAGCGTGFHPISIAMRDQDLKIDAIDLSITSIAYGKRIADKHNIKNINWIHGDILELSKIEKQYDLIESAGVLHHMKNPKKGFDILSEKLMAGGIFKLSLYARSFRNLLRPTMDMIDEIRKNYSTDDISSIRRDLINRNSRDIIHCASLMDFYATSEFRDLLMHVQEHDFNIKEIKKLFTDHFRFCGFVFPDSSNKAIRNNYTNLFPSDKGMTNLDNWSKIEEMDHNIFRSMYQIWLQKNN